jgi:hypothetical protein
MWYGGDSAQQHYGHRDLNSDAQTTTWTLMGFSGVRGFYDVADVSGIQGSAGRRSIYDWLENEYNIDQNMKELAADVSAMGGDAGSIYQQDYRHLPYRLRNGEMQVLSRWNMETQKLTVSRMQCKVRVAADGTATLTSCGKGPTLWRAWDGPWEPLYKGQRQVLADGDQVSLDWQEPEAAVFSCQVEGPLHHQDQQQQSHGLPDGWATDVDQGSGATYYYNEYTGASQWDPPLQEGGY